jgi:hypothetical protein
MIRNYGNFDNIGASNKKVLDVTVHYSDYINSIHTVIMTKVYLF